MQYESNIKKILSFAATWTDLESIMLSEISQRTQVPYDLIYIWNLLQKKKNRKPNS